MEEIVVVIDIVRIRSSHRGLLPGVRSEVDRSIVPREITVCSANATCVHCVMLIFLQRMKEYRIIVSFTPSLSISLIVSLTVLPFHLLTHCLNVSPFLLIFKVIGNCF